MKKTKTIFVSALLALSVSFAVVACNNGEEAKATTDTAAPAAADTTAPATTDTTASKPDSNAATKPVKTPTN
jgi:uncharacterized lipoprotein YehR (DUF1307 family)